MCKECITFASCKLYISFFFNIFLGSKQKWVPLDVEPIKTDKRKLTRNAKPFLPKDDAGFVNGERRKPDDLKKSFGMCLKLNHN